MSEAPDTLLSDIRKAHKEKVAPTTAYHHIIMGIMSPVENRGYDETNWIFDQISKLVGRGESESKGGRKNGLAYELRD